ncbi:hypothetical protein PC110_g19675 [Phytophthora cactorum]|uniref:Retroviral polymerase SH3-like domain-containing protein n=2 Tax=Phytophthora cactorum TaxID=29920 RepID=A0A329RHP8_9STRA|nr:hypothetical protein PC114_g20195 [Phytophthora cactorum]KAG2987387.1 hypothetical protein PC119_g19692 [Phytophthora cactorum]KAG3138832.1 hypothetical protein C6341_g20547 [Phytophthora cactorum]RAW23891.1 hypothetical protein PC110_g19675 [Phytophthora cactorum]
MKAKWDVLSKVKIHKAAMENATDKKVRRLRSDNGETSQARREGVQVSLMGYEDDVKGYRIQNEETGKVQIVRTVKFVETTSPEHLGTHQDEEDVLGTSRVPTLNGSHPR